MMLDIFWNQRLILGKTVTKADFFGIAPEGVGGELIVTREMGYETCCGNVTASRSVEYPRMLVLQRSHCQRAIVQIRQCGFDVGCSSP